MKRAEIGLSTRLTLAMTALVVLTASAVGLLTYRNVENAVLPRALERFDLYCQLLAQRLAGAVAGARADVLGFRSAAALDGIVRASLAGGNFPEGGLTLEDWKQRMATRFEAELAAKPLYTQFRIVGVADGGREILRVDRSGNEGAIRVVPDAELQRKGDRRYFVEALKLPDGAVYVSPVELNQEQGVIETPHMPVLRTATPVYAPDGRLFGAVIINVDLTAVFDRLRTESGPRQRIFLVNADGDYLVNPDRSREFGFDLGSRRRIQDDFPELVLTGDRGPRLLADRRGHTFGFGLASVTLAGGPRVSVIEAVPYDAVVTASSVIRDTSLNAGVAAALVALALAIWLARSMTRPLADLTAAVEKFGEGGPFEVSTDAGGEIGALAQAFRRMAHDVDARSAEVRSHAALIDKTISAMADGVLVVDGAGRRLFVNPAGLEMVGDWQVFGSEEWHRAFARSWPNESKRLSVEQTPLSRVLRGENFDNVELDRVRPGSGRPIRMIVSGRSIRGADGRVEYAVIVYRDVTELAEKTAALTKEIEERQRIFETSLDLIYVLDSQGNFLGVSPSVQTILGRAPDEMIGRNAGDYVHPEDLEKSRQVMREARRGKVIRNFESRYMHRDGHAVPLMWNGVWSPHERKHFFIGRDMTERLKLEQQLQQSQKMDAIGQLVGGVAHDFNNILTVITGTIEILADGVTDRPQLATIARMIDSAAQRGADLTRQLLAFARRQPLQPRKTDINGLVVEAARLLRPTLGEQIEIESMLGGEPWPAIVDPSQLSTALINLAVNARDAMPEGGKLTFETGNRVLDDDYAGSNAEVAPGDYVMIAVSDTGCGIPAALRDKVFEPFFTTKDVGKGTGLGLSMVYGFVKQSGGHIKVYSEEGHGTTVKLYLPRAADGDAALAGVQPVKEPPKGDEVILMVEDDEMVRGYVSTLLQSLGYRTLEAANGPEALALIDGGAQFDLLFTDIIMPGGMNGSELAAAARERDPSIKVLYTSGYAESALLHHGRVDSDVALLNKPYRKIDLAVRVRTVLDAPAPTPK